MSRTSPPPACTPPSLTLFRSENAFTWDKDASAVESLIAGCASYQAFSRYLVGSDLYLIPRSNTELESVLCVPYPLPLTARHVLMLSSRSRRYAYDAIHNTISQSRSELSAGGYSRVRAFSLMPKHGY